MVFTEIGVVANVDLRVDGVDETGQVDRDHDEEGEHGAPVDAGAVSVDPVVLVQHRDVEMGTSDDPVVGDL